MGYCPDLIFFTNLHHGTKSYGVSISLDFVKNWMFYASNLECHRFIIVYEIAFITLLLKKFTIAVLAKFFPSDVLFYVKM